MKILSPVLSCASCRASCRASVSSFFSSSSPPTPSSSSSGSSSLVRTSGGRTRNGDRLETLGDLDREDAGASASTTTASSSSVLCWGGAISTNSPRSIVSVVRRRGRCGRRRMRPRRVSAGTPRVNDDHVRDTLDLHERRVGVSARARPARCVYGGSFMAAWVARVFSSCVPRVFSRKVLRQIEQLKSERRPRGVAGRRRAGHDRVAPID
jgi:hypothetical protein